jgi:membrane protease YdiL (CAAX protease family)
MPAVLRKRLVLASPFLVLALGYFAAHFFTGLFGQWAWVGAFVVYWASMLLIVVASGGKTRLRVWFGRPQGSRWWFVLAATLGLIAFPILFIPNVHVLGSVPLAAAWLAFAVINSVCEEVYWRGFLLDETDHLPRVIGVAYSTILFVAVHPLVLGAFARTMAFDVTRPVALAPFLIILVAISAVWSLLYLKTGSLRWPILSHFLTDLGNLSIFVFMNMA